MKSDTSLLPVSTLLPKSVVPLVQKAAHRRDVFFRPVEPGPLAAVINAGMQFFGIRDDAFRPAVQQVAVAAGDARVAGGAMLLMYTARIERLHALGAEQGERAEQNEDLPEPHVQEQEPDLDRP